MARALVLALGIGCALGTSAACAPTPLTDQRRELLSSWGHDLVLPELALLVQSGTKLESRIDALCEAPNAASLEAVRDAWSDARRPWKQFELFAFGPARERPLQLGPQLDFWPVRTAAIDAALRNKSYEHLHLLATQKGFGGIEYLVHGPDAALLTTRPSSSAADAGTAAAIGVDAGAAAAGAVDAGAGETVAVDAGQAEPAADRCAYLRKMGQELVGDAERLYQAWDPEQDDYLAEFTSAGNGSADFDTLPMALGLVINRMAGVVRVIRDDKLEVPLGSDAEHVRLDKLESRFSGRSVTDMLDNLDGVEAAFFGEPGRLGLDDYLAHRGKSFSVQFRERSNAAKKALTALDAPLSEALQSKRQRVTVALARLQELQRLIQVDILGALSLSLQFTDTDGD
jgi:uncharacterized protein